MYYKCGKCVPSKRKRTPVSERVFSLDPDVEFFMDLWERCMQRHMKKEKVTNEMASLQSQLEMTGYCAKSWLRQSCRHRRVFVYISQVRENRFMTETQKETTLEILYATQRAYYGFQRFVFYLKKRQSGVTYDMAMEEIPMKNRVTFYDKGVRYTFSRTDIIRIIYNALTYHDSANINFFPRCIVPKNPYTNMELTSGILCEIYLQIKEMPMILECYRRVGFNLVNLEKYYSQVVRRAQIDRYLNDMDADTFGVFAECYIEYINENVFYGSLSDFQFKPHPEFPRDALHADLKKPIEYYVRYIYTYCYTEKDEFLEKLKKFTTRFFTNHPRYGRKILVKNYGKHKYNHTFCTI